MQILRYGWFSFALVVGLLWATGMCLLAQDAPVEVTAQGESDVSYDAAEQDALRTAVRQGVGVALESQTKVADFVLIRDAMISRAAGYVRSYKVTEKRRTADDTYLVGLRAECVRGRMNDDFLAIQNLIEVLGRPQFSVKVELKPGSEPGIETWLEGAFMDELDKTGLSVLDGRTANEARDRDVQRALAAGNTRKAEQLKLKMGAPYGVTVTATGSRKKDKPYGIEVTMAVVELQAAVAHRDSAEVLASRSVTGRCGSADTTGLQEACKKAVAAAFPPIMDRILAHWTRDLDIGAAITVDIADAAYATVAELVGKLRGAENVTQVEIVEAPEDGIAVVRVIGRIKAETIAGLLAKLSGGKLEVNVAGPRKVTARPVNVPPTPKPEPVTVVAPSPPPPAAIPAVAAAPALVAPGKAAPEPPIQGKPQGGLMLPAIIIGAFLCIAVLGAAVILRKK